MKLLNQIYTNSSREKYLFCHNKTKILFIVHPCLRGLERLKLLFLLVIFILRSF